jgi:hypothetical protein
VELFSRLKEQKKALPLFTLFIDTPAVDAPSSAGLKRYLHWRTQTSAVRDIAT